jgi:hypothetical protein
MMQDADIIDRVTLTIDFRPAGARRRTRSDSAKAEYEQLITKIGEYLAEPRDDAGRTTNAIMQATLGIAANRMNQAAMARVAKVMRDAGFDLVRKRMAGAERKAVWTLPVEGAVP